MPLSSRTEAALVRAVANQGHSAIGILALELGLDGRAVDGNRLDRALSPVRAVKAEREPAEASRMLFDLAERLLSNYSEWDFANSETPRGLPRAVELDGYLLNEERLIPAPPRCRRHRAADLFPRGRGLASSPRRAPPVRLGPPTYTESKR